LHNEGKRNSSEDENATNFDDKELSNKLSTKDKDEPEVVEESLKYIEVLNS
jgi:hypothetical protein